MTIFLLGMTAGVGIGVFCFLMGLRYEWRYRSLDKLRDYRRRVGLPEEGTK